MSTAGAPDHPPAASPGPAGKVPAADAVGGPTVVPVHADTARILAAGTALWVVALVLVLLVPALHTGARSWWPWSCVVGVVGGSLAVGYVRRGRGNAAEA